MEFDLNKILIAIFAAWLIAKRWLDLFSKIIEPVVVEVERLAQDGTIDKADRKAIAAKAVVIMQEKGYIKLNPISRFIVNKIIDRIAGKLPDFKVTQDLKIIIDEAKK